MSPKFCALLLLIGCSGSLYPARAQEVIDIGSLGGGETKPIAINAYGEVVGYSDTSSGNPNAFAYSAGVISDLGTLPGGNQSYADAINDSGEVVGYAIDSTGTPKAVFFSGGTANEFASNSSADGVNDSGEVVGFSGSGAVSESGGTTTNLGGGSGSTAVAINASGQIVVDNQNQQDSFLYSNGSLTSIPTLGSYVNGVAINNSGQIIGNSGTTNGPAAFLYSGGTLTNLGTLGGIESFATGINNEGEIVGTSTTSNATETAFIYAPSTGMENLNTLYSALLVSGEGSQVGFIYLETAAAINDLGEIAGTGEYYDDGSYSTQAFLLEPVGVPEPSIWGMLLGGVVGLLALERLSTRCSWLRLEANAAKGGEVRLTSSPRRNLTCISRSQGQFPGFS